MTLPITLIAGYLGAGKTTLVNHLLRHADGMKLAVLVNDFGALPIDADLIEAQDDALISITGGCVCCSYGDNLSLALSDMAALDPCPDHVILETSGVALPGAISATLSLWGTYSHDGTIVLANAETIQAQAEDTYVGDTIARQLKDADLIVLNKSDLVADVDLERTRDWLASENPHAEIIAATYGVVPPQVLLQSYLDRPSGPPVDHPDLFETHAFEPDGIVDAQALAQALARADLGLIRAKGFVCDRDGMKCIQVVARRWDVTPAPAEVKPGLVVIGLKDRVSRGDVENCIKSAEKTHMKTI